MRGWRRWAGPALLAPALLAALPGMAGRAAAQSGGVAGRAALVLPDGTEAPGEHLRVYLVRAALEVPQVDLAPGLAPLERQSRVNSGHKTFFIRFREKMDGSDYLAGHTLSLPDGTFTFEGVAPGRYWVVVTFPAMILGEKVAWQVPVRVAAGRATPVALDAANLALPCR